MSRLQQMFGGPLPLLTSILILESREKRNCGEKMGQIYPHCINMIQIIWLFSASHAIMLA